MNLNLLGTKARHSKAGVSLIFETFVSFLISAPSLLLGEFFLTKNVISFLAIVVRFLTRRFLPEYQSGIETVYHYKEGNDDIDIQIVDTCGNVSCDVSLRNDDVIIHFFCTLAICLHYYLWSPLSLLLFSSFVSVQHQFSVCCILFLSKRISFTYTILKIIFLIYFALRY